ncbi:uncharacterized protein I206_106939 [Kwoniella pini CBS 10737]|uniref:ELMO domain-containing protein n=1 Tax=Kwoniella pini CBS 10737 TaxID=1296096 RepID=A0A1B9HZM0_9TREE|nr:uncharacterized protein I206_05518 [Kwoniella pini CBS 10737]OCF48737.1 hypothetical protein I206_05518 [Kwoniella pini CBS 10737]
MSGQTSAPTPITRRGAIPTNVVTYKGRRIPARIDPEARVAYIVEIMSTSFATKEHHITLCLRDESDTLLTQNNLPSKVYNHDVLKLVPSAATEALVVITSLRSSARRGSLADSNLDLPTSSDGIPLKLALFNLQKYIKEEDFAVEFMLKGGMKMLVRLLERHEGGLGGNSLAYALQGIRGILEFESGWGELSDQFIDRMLNLVITASQPNVLKPATAIIRKLVISSPQLNAKDNNLAGLKMPVTPYGQTKKDRKGKSKEVTQVNQYGFDRIYNRIKYVVGDDDGTDHRGISGVELFFKVVVKRLEGTGDLELVAQSLGLINSCLRSGHQENSKQYPELVDLLERLSIRRYVSRLMPTSSNNVVEPQILTFQARYGVILQNTRLRPVRPGSTPVQEKMLRELWEYGRLGQPEQPSPGQMRKTGMARTAAGWKRIGLCQDGEEEAGFLMELEMFRDVGELGLESLHYFATHEDNFYNLIMEQQAKPAERRCPIGKASSECVKILCEHYKISQAGHHSPANFQLFLLNFSKLHQLVLRFFMRMWQESASQTPDFPKVSFLVRSQIRLSLSDEGNKTWLNLEQDFLDTEYRTIRDRQMELLEKEDGMMSRYGVRELRDKLGREGYEVLSEQRIGCMLQGGWFNSALLNVPGISSSVRPNAQKPLRFMRLSLNRKVIAWDQFSHRIENPSFEFLRERLDIASISSVRLQTGCAVNSRSPNLVSKLSFSIMGEGETSLLDLDAIHAAQMAEWTDGIRVLRGEGGMSSKESADYIHILAELALKVRLLDITGDGVEIPEKITFGAAPQSVDFVFAK